MQNTSSFQVYNASAGSGKTFTLVKEYLKILLTSSNPFKFQQVLAVTFTNKAAGEMKERVIENLNAFSKGETTDMLKIISEEIGLSEKEICKKSEAILNAILQNYSAFSITTIDSFTHKLIRTFAYDLELPMNSEVEMDTESLLNEAVDVVISKIGENKEITDLLVNFAVSKLDDDKSWDISRDLNEFSKIILNETNALQFKSLSSVPVAEFHKLKGKLQKQNKEIDKRFVEIGNRGLELINNEGLEFKDFLRGTLPNHFQKLATDASKASFFDQNKLKENIENGVFYAKSKSDDVKTRIDAITPSLVNLYRESEKLYQQKTLNDLILNSLIPLAVLNHINKALQEIKKENNILLNAEFNQLISDTIKDEPAPFIYERIGEKFRYYFIDEMQDTSVLQWQNLIPLINNAISSVNELGEQGKLLLVGDAKQSIYRWRGGKAEQFIGLTSKDVNANPFFVEEKIENLATNYRSYSEVINFNNGFFTHIAQFISNPAYSNLYKEGNNQLENKNKGGYVQLSFIEKQKESEETVAAIHGKVLEIVENLDKGFQKSDICVLVRTKKQGVSVADFLTEKGFEIISSETLLLKNNPKVQFIINLLGFVQNVENKELKAQLLYFLFDAFNIQEEKHTFLSKFINLEIEEFFIELKHYGIIFSYENFVQMPFYESIEYAIRQFNLAPTSDSNIQFFLDVIFDFQQKKQASLNGFLEFWELKKDSFSIVAPEAKNAIRIMTIHKAKGLEFPVVIYPFNLNIYYEKKPKTWISYNESDSIHKMYVNYNKKLKDINAEGELLYNERREELELDNFNVLYVALTRAVEQLYVVTDINNSKKGEDLKNTSEFFEHYLNSINVWEASKSTYSFGNPKKQSLPSKESSKTQIQHNFISNSWRNQNISIVANSSQLWGTEKGDAVDYGNLIHEILSKIKTANDIDEVLNEYLFKGIITVNEKSEIEIILGKIVNHKLLYNYFEQNNTVLNEQEIVTEDKQIVIPDRLVFNNKQVTIIDYKTGKQLDKYKYQLNKYASALSQLNFKVEKKILVYINNEILVEEL